jgi:hypothetical protein
MTELLSIQYHTNASATHMLVLNSHTPKLQVGKAYASSHAGRKRPASSAYSLPAKGLRLPATGRAPLRTYFRFTQ